MVEYSPGDQADHWCSRGHVLLVLSGNDLTAQEFIEYTQRAPAWRGLLAAPRVERFDLPESDHTFSSAAWRAAVADRMLAWLRPT